ncbi:hypothetical protein BN890_7020 [Bacteroides xylanisolvens SD CC 1b]|uniref:Uncharacterized protein n=1 Tax=Bacteroides xylanisolvens SD CC 1b TaxID=702447 RepID=W6PGI2_9BACE|nr:hypothetical protein BN890_7020 [Bacteroides xylanisolvens SD CC 1b]
MRNNKNEYEKCLFLGTEHRKNMRNANFLKVFLIFYYIMFQQVDLYS